MKPLTLLTLALLTAALTGCGIRSNPGLSEKVGTVVSIHKVGIIFDTWEAQIVRGGFSGGTGIMGAPFNFTIEDEKLVPQIKQAMESGSEIKITYRTEGIFWTARSDSRGDFLVSVEPIKK